MKAINAVGFEEKFRENIDPWNYQASRFEAYKRRVLVAACGERLRGRGLELACAIGVTTRALQPKCLRLIAIDASPTALQAAEAGAYGRRRPHFRLGLLPRDVPRAQFDLIVMSEIAYYLSPRDLGRLCQKTCAALAPGGRVVVLHHLKPFPDAAQLPARAHAFAINALSRHLHRVQISRDRHFAVAAFDK